jgi:hypothetical protein
MNVLLFFFFALNGFYGSKIKTKRIRHNKKDCLNVVFLGAPHTPPYG